MKRSDPDAPLTPEQARAADAGLKAMMPVAGRPFLDYLLNAAADAGLTDVALVVAPHHEEVRHYYEIEAPPSRLTIDFVVQSRPEGTADAVHSAEAWAGDTPFLVLNGDNLYPVDALRALAALDGPGVAAFDRATLVEAGGIGPSRLRAFAMLHVAEGGWLTRVDEKPSPDSLERAGEHAPISLNAWRFDRRIFAACRAIVRSERGELELPAAVNLAIEHGASFKVVPARGPVLDLSHRSDLASVASRLAGITPRL